MELQRKASSVGFDWNDPREVLRKIREEADEIEAALDHGNADELADETGDLLFVLVNLARHVGVDPDLALRGTNAKFERRFGYIERPSRRRAARCKTRRSRRWTRCGMKPRARSAHRPPARRARADVSAVGERTQLISSVRASHFGGGCGSRATTRPLVACMIFQLRSNRRIDPSRRSAGCARR